MCAVAQTNSRQVCIFKTEARDLMGLAVDSLVIKNKSSHPVNVGKIMPSNLARVTD